MELREEGSCERQRERGRVVVVAVNKGKVLKKRDASSSSSSLLVLCFVFPQVRCPPRPLGWRSREWRFDAVVSFSRFTRRGPPSSSKQKIEFVFFFVFSLTFLRCVITQGRTTSSSQKQFRTNCLDGGVLPFSLACPAILKNKKERKGRKKKVH